MSEIERYYGQRKGWDERVPGCSGRKESWKPASVRRSLGDQRQAAAQHQHSGFQAFARADGYERVGGGGGIPAIRNGHEVFGHVTNNLSMDFFPMARPATVVPQQYCVERSRPRQGEIRQTQRQLERDVAGT